MLKQLSIRNFTLIDSLDIKFNPGFSVITGETGAGKSIILGAIGLLLGQRADSKAIKNGAAKCTVEAHFDLSKYDLKPFFDLNEIDYDPEDCIIRREVSATGKSRAFINDTPEPLSLLKELGERLIDIHSQHQNLLLDKQDFQLEVVDIIAEDGNTLAAYKQAFANFSATKRELDGLRAKIESDKANADFIKFQHEELSTAALKDGEQEELEGKAETMGHAEEIKVALYEADKLLSADDSGAVSALHSAAGAIQGVKKVLPAATELADRMESAYIELKDISEEIGSQLEGIDFDPAELERINDRLDNIYSLEKKYHCDTVSELLQLQEKLARQVNDIDNSDEAFKEMSAKLDKAQAECQALGERLTAARKASARKIEQEMSERLMPLGMPNVRFSVDVEAAPMGNSGSDKVSFLFSANKNIPLQPVSQVASGGEIARVMLSLKAMTEKMALIMQQMGHNNRQVISITHLPQIAALGQTHYKVYKEDNEEGTISHMKLLEGDDRVKEIAQMLSGSDITEAAINNAKELLKQ